MKTASLSIAALIVIFAIMADCQKDEAAWAGRIEEVDGVTIVHNPAKPRAEYGVLELAEDLSIGQEAGDPEYLFSGIGGMAVDRQGHIYAIDSREAAVRVFDKEGRYLRTIGRKGQGPGETHYPVFLQITARGELAVYDYNASVMLFYSLDGIYLRQQRTPRPMLPIGLDSGGCLIAQYILAPPPKGGKVILRFDRDYGSEQELAREGMGPDRVFDIGRPSCFAAVAPDDRVLWGDSREYVLYLLSSEGKLVKRIAKEFRPQAITDAERDEYRKKYADALKFGMQISFRDRWPAFNGLFFDDEGRLLVRTYERAGGSGNTFCFDVFDRDGVYEYRVALPMTLDRNSVWKDGRLYTTKNDDRGLPLIKRYRILWRRGGPSS
jgi:hypothetical protein